MKIKIFVASLLLLVVGFFIFTPKDILIPNTFLNPSFEKGNESWSGPADCSSARPNTPIMEGKIVSDEKADGNNSFQVTAQYHLIGLNTPIKGIVPGNLYRLSFMAKSADLENPLDINIYEGNLFTKFLKHKVTPLSSGWKQYDFIFRSQEKFDTPTLVVYVEPRDKLVKVYFDNFALYSMTSLAEFKMKVLDELKINQGMVIKLAVLGFLALFFVWAKLTNRLNKSFLLPIAAKVGLVAFSFYLACIAANIYCYKTGAFLEDWQIKYFNIAKKNGWSVELKRPEEALLYDRAHGKEEFPYYPPIHFIGDPDLPSYIPSAPKSNYLYCNENGYFMRFQTDKRGFNNPPETDLLDSIDYAFLGDSFTFGACVNQGKNFVDRFRQKFPKTVNFGVPASGPLMQYAVFRQFIEESHPKNVVWNFISNDFTDLENEMRNPTLMKYVSDPNFKVAFSGPDQTVKLREIYMARFNETNKLKINQLNQGLFLKTLGLFHLRLLVEKRQTQLTTGNALSALPTLLTGGAVADAAETAPAVPVTNINPEVAKTYRWILEDIDKRTKSWGGQLYIYFDDFYAASESFPVRSMATELKIPIIDIVAAVNKQTNVMSVPVFRPGHYSESGYSFVGDQLVKELEARLPVSSPAPEKK